MAITAISRDWGVSPSIVRVITTDNFTAITTAQYLTVEENNIELLNNGSFEWASTDLVAIDYLNGEGFFTHDAINNTFISLTEGGSLSSTLSSGNIFVGNASNVATGVPMSGDVTINNAGVTAIGAGKVLRTMLSPLLLQYAVIPVTAAEFNGMYASPKLLIPAAGPNTMIILMRATLVMTYGGTPFVGIGNVVIQYGATIHGAGIPASTDIVSAEIPSTHTDAMFPMVGKDDTGGLSTLPFSQGVNIGLYLSNSTQPFTSGNSNFQVHVWYSVIPSV